MRESLKNKVLALAARGNNGLKDPKFGDVLAVAPHLTREEAVQLMQCQEDRIDFIGPPLLIRGAAQVYSLQRRRNGRVLCWAGTYRRKESFNFVSDSLLTTPDGVWTGIPNSNADTSTGWRYVERDYQKRVADYAELFYGRELYWDESRQIIDHHLHYPDGSVLIITAGYGQSWDEMQMLSNGRCPFLQMLDDQLKVATLISVAACEIRGGRTPMVSNNCGLCGGPVNVSCGWCAQVYPNQRREWHIPLHRGLLEATGMLDGKFKHDPIDPIKVHYAKWAASGATSRIAMPQRDRVITFRDDT